MKIKKLYIVFKSLRYADTIIIFLEEKKDSKELQRSFFIEMTIKEKILKIHLVKSKEEFTFRT